MLRLVDEYAAPPTAASSDRNTPAHPGSAVATENRAGRLSGFDSRWVLAMRTAQMLEGGRTALLRPNHRRKLVSLASKMGLRPFDAALIIAIVQDAARAEEPLTGDAQDRLALIRPASEPGSGAFDAAALFLVSFFLAAFLFTVMRLWLIG